MPTNDERREVASKLRGLAEKYDGVTSFIVNKHLGLISCDRFLSGAVFTSESVEDLADLIDPEPVTGSTSDGYHTFDELYDHRAKLFSVIVAAFPERSWKSKSHSDGTMYEGMFIVGIETPDGQATYHYDIDPYWNIFNCKELESAPEWDGHTPSQAIDRIASLADLVDHEAERTCSLKFNGVNGYVCTCCGVSLASKYFTDSNNELWRIKKCPNCGAKVVE